MTLIGLISDVHATPEPVTEALEIFEKAGVNLVLCAGDIAGYMDKLDETVKLLVDHDCQTIVGNHDLKYIDHHDDGSDSTSINFLKNLPATYETVIEGKSLYMVHAQPPDGCHGGIKLLDKNAILIPDNVEHWSDELQAFNYDVLIVGHTHQVFAEVLGGTLVINPGSSVFNNSCAILRLPEMTVEMFALSGKEIEKTWNWGEHMIYGK
ncbi:MAG: metallophosphoesterase family protein [Proteobacteria bacterium]|nr:metallophosphoesterase family protein [Pseudomonadota bacterium]